jgi:uncharacterized protein (DUF433 family)
MCLTLREADGQMVRSRRVSFGQICDPEHSQIAGNGATWVMGHCQRSVMREKHLDWSTCAATEIVPGRMAGQPVIRSSRVRPQDLIANREQGAEWLSRNHSLPIEMVQEVLAFYEQHERALAPSP